MCPLPRLALPGPEELTAHAIVHTLGLAGKVRIEELGRSRTGRPIPLISVGEGPLSALVVGAPHPNEPTGCLTILRMLARFAAMAEPPIVPGWQWHFIPAIDIDGVALNAGWLSESPALETYLAHFYRPPFRLQPEYGFPLDLPQYSFSTETPENACWKKALEMTKPDLQCSLHGADSGGAFFILSAEHRDLADRLTPLPASFGVSLNAVGEPFAEMAVFQPGVFSFPSVAAIIEGGIRHGSKPKTFWNAGDSSAGFAAERFGTFSLTCEVPLWRDAREGDSRLSDRTLGEVVDERVRLLREDAEALGDSLPALRPAIGTFEAHALLESLEDALAGAVGVMSALARARPRGAEGHRLRISDLVSAEAGTYCLRTPAMLLRLASITGSGAVEDLARSMLDARLTRFRKATRLSPVPLAWATGVQMAAIDAAASVLGRSSATVSRPV